MGREACQVLTPSRILCASLAFRGLTTALGQWKLNNRKEALRVRSLCTERTVLHTGNFLHL